MEQNGLLEEDPDHKEHTRGEETLEPLRAHSKALYLCDAQDTDVGAGGGGSIPCPKHSVQNTGETLDENPPVNPKQKTSLNKHGFTRRVFYG